MDERGLKMVGWYAMMTDVGVDRASFWTAVVRLEVCREHGFVWDDQWSFGAHSIVNRTRFAFGLSTGDSFIKRQLSASF